MAYSDFTLPELVRRFGLTIIEDEDLFGSAPPQQPSALLADHLTEYVPLALALNTEKARSELIIMPVLLEVRRRLERSISLFSGAEFTVAPELGLNGVCDYILSRAREQLFIRAPVMMIVEAKNENMKASIGQCGAAMVAAQRFNEREGNAIDRTYGAVTIGDAWRFLRLDGVTLAVDRPVYYIDRIDRILGILLHAASGTVAHVGR